MLIDKILREILDWIQKNLWFRHEQRKGKPYEVLKVVRARKGILKLPRMRYSAKPGNPGKSSIRQIKLYAVAVKTAVSGCKRRNKQNEKNLQRSISKNSTWLDA